MPPKIKVKPKLKGVTKQEKAAATRAGFKSVAEYRKSKRCLPVLWEEEQYLNEQMLR